MSRKRIFSTIAVILGTSLSSSAYAWFFIFPIPNLAKPAPLSKLIDALEQSEETRAVAYVAEDKAFGSKYWVWSHYSGHVTQAEADRIALSRCQQSLAKAKAQTAGGKELYDFGTKVCELYEFANKKVSPLATESQPNTSATASPTPTVPSASVEAAQTWVNSTSTFSATGNPVSINPYSVSPTGVNITPVTPNLAEQRPQATPVAPATEKPAASPVPPPAQPATPVDRQAAPIQSTSTSAPTPPSAASSTPVISSPAQSQTNASQSVESSTARRLRELSDLRKQGLITESEYNQKRKAILSAM